MGRVLDRLRASQMSLWSPSGFWALLVSQVLDGLLPGGRQLLQVRRTGTNQVVSSGTDVVLNSIAVQSGIPYDTATGIATLTAGHTYRLTAEGVMTTFAGGTDEIDLEWVDALSNAPLLDDVVGMWKPVSNGLSVAPDQTTEVIVTPASNQQVKLRCTASSGSAEILRRFFTAIIQEL